MRAQEQPSLQQMLPLIEDWRWQLVVLLAGFLLLVVGSDLLMRWFVARHVPAPARQDPEQPQSPTDHTGVGRVIGKCENLLVFALVLLCSFEGLGLVLAAKSIARMDAMRKNPSYYLGGTLLNFVWSLFVSLALRLIVFGPP